jgi:hypothetical protein
MKARRFLEQNAAFDPEQLMMVTKAFEEAWAAIEARYCSETDRESVRMRLATLILEFAKQGITERAQLVAIASEALNQPMN